MSFWNGVARRRRELLGAITQRSFLFIAHLVIKVLALSEPPNRALQAEDVDVFNAVTLVDSASA